MRFVIAKVTNEGDALEADLYASLDGLTNIGEPFHLVLGSPVGGDDALTPREVLRLIGLAIVDQLGIGDEFIAAHGRGARSLLLALHDTEGQLVLRYDVGVEKRRAIDALIDAGRSFGR